MGQVVTQEDTQGGIRGAVRLPLSDGPGPEFVPASRGRAPQNAAWDGSGPHRRRLRVALAMKGGVSLAVWIGGAVTELDVLRRIRLAGTRDAPEAYLLMPTNRRVGSADGSKHAEHMLSTHHDLITRATQYARAMHSRGYDAIEFDVLAGASAGGLNAVMYGVAQRAGTTTDTVLDLWRESGDVWRLLRGRGVRSVDSVLNGDGYFWGEMLTTLTDLNTRPDAHGLTAPVSIDLSATVLDGEGSSERGTREGKAHFRFSGGLGGEDAGRDIPSHRSERAGPEDASAAANVSLTRLAYAARTTSSFPGAFEAAKIYSGPDVPDGAVDMSSAFHAYRDAFPFRVVDGGVTDNVPIDRALRAIRNRSAETYVNRALVYLDPSPTLEFDGLVRPITYGGSPPAVPGSTSKPKRADDPRSYFLGVVFSAIGRMFGRESKDDEVDEVERFRRLLFLEQGKDELFAPITEQLFRPAAAEAATVDRPPQRGRR